MNKKRDTLQSEMTGNTQSSQHERTRVNVNNSDWNKTKQVININKKLNRLMQEKVNAQSDATTGNFGGGNRGARTAYQERKTATAELKGKKIEVIQAFLKSPSIQTLQAVKDAGKGRLRDESSKLCEAAWLTYKKMNPEQNMWQKSKAMQNAKKKIQSLMQESLDAVSASGSGSFGGRRTAQGRQVYQEKMKARSTLKASKAGAIKQFLESPSQSGLNAILLVGQGKMRNESLRVCKAVW